MRRTPGPSTIGLRASSTGPVKDDTELFKQFSDNPDFKRWLADAIFSTTYDRSSSMLREDGLGREFGRGSRRLRQSRRLPCFPSNSTYYRPVMRELFPCSCAQGMFAQDPRILDLLATIFAEEGQKTRFSLFFSCYPGNMGRQGGCARPAHPRQGRARPAGGRRQSRQDSKQTTPARRRRDHRRAGIGGAAERPTEPGGGRQRQRQPDARGASFSDTETPSLSSSDRRRIAG